LLSHVDYKNIELYLAMDIKEEEEIKKEFQLERVVLFTDAVFAIILTIMVLELKLPEAISKLSDLEIHDAFKELILKFFGYVITFGLVARFWVVHLKLFRYLKDYDQKLLGLNLLFLFAVTLFPFAVSLIARKTNPETHPGLYNLTWLIYVAVLFTTIFTQSLISRHLLMNREKLCIKTADLETNFEWKVGRVNLFLIPTLMVVLVILVFLNLPYYVPVYVVAVYGIVVSRIKKKYYAKNDKGPLIAQLYRYIKSAGKKQPIAKT
jgi:uncharacterized membrane protein